ncbi:hypothetical protein [Archangium sp.]|jgi:hypothetical protein|uniref:hypothetical protein n=1 Tax=Archangium sp. TaxID=1872627 RepID=UPI002ED98677
MHGPEILARTLSVPAAMGTKGERWQYHPRSDRHSKVACWGILFDLLQTSDVLAEHVRTGKVAFGINHEMVDFRLNRKKNLDLVLCTPGTPVSGKRYGSFRGLIERYGISPSKKEQRLLDSLPDVPEAPVGTVRIALEAKAAMTAHVKALPRLYDELNSSHATIHGNTELAVAVGLVMVNLSEQFQSPGLDAVSRHRQPDDTKRVVQKVRELPRRVGQSEPGFDAIGITVVSCANDGSAVELVTTSPAPQSNEMDHYDQMIRRAVQIYESRYPAR